jgi:CRISPR/Cas system-associated exonuclease Cas4 (RecB family)
MLGVQMTTPAETVIAARNISNSELAAWLQCERKYYYNFDLGIEPKSHGATLSRGIAGHLVLEAYYQSLVDKPGDFIQAKMCGTNRLNNMLENGEFDIELLIDLKRLFDRYFPYVEARDQHWQILAVEKTYAMPLMEQFNYQFKLDVLARINGELTVVDHKFVYDFYKQHAVDMMPQIPKYIATLRAQGLNVEYGMLNMLRWRMKKGPMTDDEIFQRMPIKPHPELLVGVMREQMLGSTQLIEHRKLPLEVREKTVLRSMNKLNCQNCGYNQLCFAQLHGHDIAVDIQLNYQPSKYVQDMNEEGG